jgi:hypothetical protein
MFPLINPALHSLLHPRFTRWEASINAQIILLGHFVHDAAEGA